jgi:L-threonylcarbamoyladenylate synthase
MFPDIGRTLANEFWPGPLTLVVQKTSHVPDTVTAGLDTVAVRMPNHQVALSLLRQFGRGIVAPSANVSGRPSPTTAQHVLDDLDGRIDIVLDSGPTLIGVESTVLDITVEPPVILRKGGLSKEAIEKVIGTVLTEPDEQLSARSPGNRHKHYAPRARVILVPQGDAVGLGRTLRGINDGGKRIACLLHSIPDPPADAHVSVQRAPGAIDEFAHFLFDYFRQWDKSGINVIVVEEVSEIGLGAAIMDRLRRAASASGN